MPCPRRTASTVAEPGHLPRPAPPIRRASLRYPRRPRPPRDSRHTPWRWAARRRRLLFLLLVGSQTLVATYYMTSVLPYHATTALEIALVVAFALSFAWVSTGAWLALFGFFYRRLGGDPKSLERRTRCAGERGSQSRTALVMPIYHEPVATSFAGLAAVYRALERKGVLERFDFYVLSDSRDPDIWLNEQHAWRHWVGELNAEGRLYYRRRHVNLRHKSGNVADFLRRWGQDYEYFVVLDADSLMDAATLVHMTELMDANPRVGILQAPPSIICARSLFARIQQFANRLYGLLFSTGLAAIQLGDGAYWGHNAIIRTRAFMRHCGLPSLRGIGLFRGPILSHDFVEAAYMRRGGYEVWLEPALAGSYEQSPPSLVDELTRDRRWARGNLQHLPIMLGERGLGLVQRFIFVNGILAYAAAPLWLLFLILSGVEVAQFTLWPINYFPGGHHRLFPVWPQWHPEWAIRLAASTAFVLFVPKILSCLDALFRSELRRSFGGGLSLLAGVVIESIASVLLAPVRMLTHSRFVLEALVGLRISWGGQNRGGEIGWWAALLMHGDGLVLGLGWGIFSWWLRPLYFYWSLPVIVPLVLAAPVAVITSRLRSGAWFARRRLLLTPEDRDPPPVIRDYEALLARAGKAAANGLAATLKRPSRLATARWFARRDGRCTPGLLKRALRDGTAALSMRERRLLAEDGEALESLFAARESQRKSPSAPQKQ